MDVKNIYTNRYYQDWPSWYLVYEWEDELSKQLNLTLVDSRKGSIITFLMDKGVRIISKIGCLPGNSFLKSIDKFITKKKSLSFEMIPQESFQYSTSKNTIPMIIDFWGHVNLNNFYRTYENCELVLISSIEAFNYLKNKNCPLNIKHFPLSIPDKYKIDINKIYNKKYDVLLAGRTNSILWEYLQKYEKKYPDIEYLYQKQIDKELYYVSNKSGIIGKFHSRESYMNLLESAKVSFYSTPGIDGGEERTGKFNPVTPRFFEILAAGCHIIARYPKNAETDYFNLESICPSVDTYELFEQELNKVLSTNEIPIERNEKYLSYHYTSKRADLLKEILIQSI
jgi:hypothetical protein